LEKSERNYSDIDLIYEKNASRKKKPQTQAALDEDELDELFKNLMEE
jgi:hypothetical protein